MKHLFILAFIIVYASFGLELGYTASSPWHTHITYMFQHAGLWHLAVNSVVFFILFRNLQNHFSSLRIVAVAMLSAFAMSFLCYYDKPVVGASGMVYAMIGMYFFLLVKCRIRFREPMGLFVFLLSIAVALVMGFKSENSAGLLHLLCLIAGFAVTATDPLIKKWRRQRRPGIWNQCQKDLTYNYKKFKGKDFV